MSQHKIVKCKDCGTTIMQCRCPNGQHNVEYSICSQCKQKLLQPPSTKSPVENKVWNLWEHKLGWGHDLFWMDFENRKIAGFYPDRWLFKEGQEIRDKMQSGKIARFKIIEIFRPNSPHDQLFLTVTDLDYL